MELFLIRHGQSVGNALWDASGMRAVREEDPPLSGLGVAQTEAMAEAFAGRAEPRITRVYCSLMVRAVQTGVVLARRLGVPLEAWIDIHEVGGMYVEDEAGGQFLPRHGKGRSYFHAGFADMILPAELSDAGWWHAPFEQDGARPARALRVADALLRMHKQGAGCIALITHLGFYNQLLAVLLGLPAPHEGRAWFGLDNTGVTRVQFGPPTVIAYANRPPSA